ncbi:hypothetical protein J4441_01760 [Candidatus Micrarchaeota archaeon]|nr:hypothetical protein [Candidatus Micrarchaeota archaeon]
MKMLIVGALALLVFLAGCVQEQPQACTDEAKLCPDGSYVGRNASNNCEFDSCPFAPGTLYGTITIGPLCPLQPCERDASAFYEDMQVNVYRQNGQLEKRAYVDANGQYGMRLGSGSYVLNVTDRDGNVFGIPGGSMNYELQMQENLSTRLDFDIDTGIR